MNFRVFLILAAGMGMLTAQPFQWTTIGGSAGYGASDGTNTEARFWIPMGIAAAQSGNCFVSDYRNNNIRKLSRLGADWIVTTVAGTARVQGGMDGLNGAAQFYNPKGVTTDAHGNVYVADTYNHTIRKLTPMGADWSVTTIAGLTHTPGWVDGVNGNARFYFPYGVLAAPDGIVYVTDSGTVRRLSLNGNDWIVTTIAGRGGYYGSADGTNSTARFLYPSDPVMDNEGNIYVTDTRNFTIRKLSPMGTNWVATTIAGQAGVGGSADGTNNAARFYYADGLAMSADGAMFVADSSNHTIRRMVKVGTNWLVTTIAGLAGISGDTDGSNSLARFNYPHGIAVINDRSLLVTDGSNYKLRNVRLEGTNWVVQTIAGCGGPESRDGFGSDARFDHPWGIAVANGKTIFVSDENNHTVRRVAKTGPNWLVSTVAGTSQLPGNLDGTNNGAFFRTPRGVAMDQNGVLYLSDHSNNIIRKISFTGQDAAVVTIAGSPGVAGSLDGTNTSALFNRPLGIAVDVRGNLYVADNQMIRTVTPMGPDWITKTLAGQAGASGYLDGSNGAARFSSPCGVAVDSATNIFVADFGNYVIRKITSVGTNWVVSTIAGLNGTPGRQDGINGAARFWNPYGVAVDSGGSVYVTDAGNHAIRKITPAGSNWVVTTIGGLGTAIGLPDFQGNEDGVGSAARFAWPTSLAVANDGTLFVADYWNNVVRQGTQLPMMGLPELDGGTVRLHWTAVTGWQYQLQAAANLSSAEWTNVGNAISATTEVIWTQDTASGSGSRYYRVRRIP